MTSLHDASTESVSEPVRSPGRRDAVRSLAGLGTASVALLGGNHAAGASPNAELSGQAAKKKRGKRGKRGRTGPPGPGATISRVSNTISILAPDNATLQVNCLSGEAIGGGVGIGNTSCELVSSGPVGAIGWSATGKCSIVEAIMTVTVICLG